MSVSKTDMPMPSSLDGKVPLRVNSTTVIYVDPKNATPEYLKKYLKRLKKSDSVTQKLGRRVV